MPAERKARTPVATQACGAHSEERPGFATQRAGGQIAFAGGGLMNCPG